MAKSDNYKPFLVQVKEHGYDAEDPVTLYLVFSTEAWNAWMQLQEARLCPPGSMVWRVDPLAVNSGLFVYQVPLLWKETDGK